MRLFFFVLWACVLFEVHCVCPPPPIYTVSIVSVPGLSIIDFHSQAAVLGGAFVPNKLPSSGSYVCTRHVPGRNQGYGGGAWFGRCFPICVEDEPVYDRSPVLGAYYFELEPNMFLHSPVGYRRVYLVWIFCFVTAHRNGVACYAVSRKYARNCF